MDDPAIKKVQATKKKRAGLYPLDKVNIPDTRRNVIPRKKHAVEKLTIKDEAGSKNKKKLTEKRIINPCEIVYSFLLNSLRFKNDREKNITKIKLSDINML